MKVWAYIDHHRSDGLPASWEALGLAKTLGPVTAVVLGSDVGALVKTACEYGADEVLLAEDACLAEFVAETYASTLSQAVSSGTCDLMLLPDSSRGRDLAAMLGVDLNTGVLVDAVAVQACADGLTVTRPIYGGRVLVKETCSTRPAIVTLRGRAFPVPDRQVGAVGPLNRLAAVPAKAAAQVEGFVRAEGISLSSARTIVSGGRGLAGSGPDERESARRGFALLKELADALGGAVGASRAAVDAGYAPYEQQVGQTGRTVTPDLYIACGISGAIQHLAGMRTSKVIVAINSDPSAPIFGIARFGAVGDVFQIVPALTSALESRLAR